MKRFFNKAVFYDQLMRLRPILIFIVITELFEILSVWLQRKQTTWDVPPVQASVSMLEFLLFFSVILCFKNKFRTYDFFSAQPVTRDQLMVSKSLAVIVVLYVPYVISTMIELLIAATSGYANMAGVMGHQGRWLVIMFAFIFFSLALHMLFQCLFGKTMAGFGVMWFLGIFVPLYLTMLCGLSRPVKKFIEWTGIQNLNPDSFLKYFSFDGSGMQFVNSLLLMLFAAAAIWAMTFVLHRRFKVESTSNICMFKWVEKAVRIFITLFATMVLLICLGGIAFWIIRYHMNPSAFAWVESHHDGLETFANVIYLPACALLYWVDGKIRSKFKARRCAAC